MKKILVTTDYSNQSKAAIRLAIQLESQTDVKLTFFHAYKVLRPTRWNDAAFYSYEHSQEYLNQKKLTAFVKAIYQSQKATLPDLDCIVYHQRGPDLGIMSFAESHGYSLICISRKGTGSISALFGSTISKLITKTNVPIIAVPENYRRTGISKICFASDLFNLDKELGIVSDFAKWLHARVDFLHFEVPFDQLISSKTNDETRLKLQEHQFHPHFKPMNYEKTLNQNINKAIKELRPNLMIMFSRKRKSLLEKILLSSISSEYAFITKVPLLIFRKAER